MVQTAGSSNGEFIWPVRVYYEDTDAGGVVFYANYLRFMERARTEWLRHKGFEQDTLMREDGVVFVVRNVVLDFKRPARFNEVLNVTARVADHGKASMTFEQQVRTHGAEAVVCCSGRVTIVCVDARRLRPRAIPQRLMEEINDAV